MQWVFSLTDSVSGSELMERPEGFRAEELLSLLPERKCPSTLLLAVPLLY